MARHELSRKRISAKNFNFDPPLRLQDLALHSATENIQSPGTTTPMHMQRCYEFVLSLSGVVELQLDTETVSIQSGEVCVLHPGQMHRLTAGMQKDVHYISIGISTVDLPDNHPLQQALLKLHQLSSPVRQCDAELEPIMRGVLREFRQKRPYYKEMAHSALWQVIFNVYRLFYPESEQEYDGGQRNNSSQDIVFWIINHINANLFEINSASDLADAIGYSYSYLSHAFSRMMNMSIRDYIMRCKIETAKELLQTSDLSVTQIAETLHYQSIHSFSKSFKKVTGVSPLEYVRRNNLRNKGRHFADDLPGDETDIG